MLPLMAKDKGATGSADKEKGKEKGKGKRVKVLGPATIARPALVGAAVLALVKVATKG
jgi:hypothetical protein